MDAGIIVMSIWDSLIDPFIYLTEEIIGNPLLIGVVFFLFITMIGLLMFIPIEAMVVVWIPTCFVVGSFIPSLQIVVGVMLGIVVGLAIIKWVRR